MPIPKTTSEQFNSATARISRARETFSDLAVKVLQGRTRCEAECSAALDELRKARAEASAVHGKLRTRSPTLR